MLESTQTSRAVRPLLSFGVLLTTGLKMTIIIVIIITTINITITSIIMITCIEDTNLAKKDGDQEGGAGGVGGSTSLCYISVEIYDSLVGQLTR